MKLIYVPSVDAVWPELSEAMTRTAAKLKRPVDVEDVKAEIREKRAGLFLLDCGGFVLARQVTECGVRIFHIWMLYSKTLNKRLPEVVAAIDQVAADMGCQMVRFQSPRRFWRRFPYFREASVVYERMLDV